MATGKVFTGCRAVLKMNGIAVGYARNVSLRESIQYQAIDVLDNIETAEHVPVGYTVTGSASLFRLVAEDLKSAGVFPKTGNTPEEHLTNILNTGALTATLIDNQTTKALATVTGVRISDQDLTVDARGVAGNNVTLIGLRMKSEADA